MSFEVASVKLNSEFRPPSFPLDNGNAFKPGGRFFANFPVLTYIQFAYKVSLTESQRQSMLSQLPKWFATDRFDIDAKADGLPTKDQIRLMMQSLLAERFHLAVHFETQDTAVLALTLVKPGKTGPKLRPHSEGPACDTSADGNTIFPTVCYVQQLMMKNNILHAGSRNSSMELLASALSGLGRLGRPVVDRTGLTGEVDYEIQWVQEPAGAAPPDPATAAADVGPTFREALHDQLGLKLEPARAPLRILVVDHIERPSEN